jgi:hypothetical protein
MATLTKYLCVGLALFAFASGAAPAAADGIETTEGQIHEIDNATSMLLISGVTYYIAVDAKVEIAGTFGAPTMLTPGMNVRFTFHRHDDGRREIIEIAQLPDDVKPQMY